MLDLQDKNKSGTDYERNQDNYEDSIDFGVMLDDDSPQAPVFDDDDNDNRRRRSSINLSISRIHEDEGDNHVLVGRELDILGIDTPTSKSTTTTLILPGSGTSTNKHNDDDHMIDIVGPDNEDKDDEKIKRKKNTNRRVKRRKILTDGDETLLSDEHVRNMLADNSDIMIANTNHNPSTWNHVDHDIDGTDSNNVILKSILHKTNTELLISNLKYEQLYTRPSLSDDCLLSPILLTLFYNNMAPPIYNKVSIYDFKSDVEDDDTTSNNQEDGSDSDATAIAKQKESTVPTPVTKTIVSERQKASNFDNMKDDDDTTIEVTRKAAAAAANDMMLNVATEDISKGSPPNQQDQLNWSGGSDDDFPTTQMNENYDDNNYMMDHDNAAPFLDDEDTRMDVEAVVESKSFCFCF